MIRDTARYLLGRADARRLPLADRSVHMIVTSPPYYGLRDYGTARWDGGDPACDHKRHNPDSNAELMALAPSANTAGARSKPYTDRCGKCGAVRVDSQIGLETTPEEYINNIVCVFRELRRVLRDDGTAFLNLGDSYASQPAGNRPDKPSGFQQKGSAAKSGALSQFGGRRSIGTNLSDCLDALAKGRPLVIGNAATIRVAAQGRNIPLHDERFPYRKFLSLFGVQRVTIKQRDNDFCQVLHTLADPCYCWIGCPVLSMSRHVADLEIVLDSGYDLSIVIADHDADRQAKLTILGAGGAGTGKRRDGALAVEESAEPIAEIIADGETIGNTVAFDPVPKRLPDVYLVDEAVPLGDRLDPPPGTLGDFRVTQAGAEQLGFASEDGRVNLSTRLVRQLFVPNEFGSLVHYSELYDKATRKSNTLRSKQELGIPEMVKRALMEDGWICRSTIIWDKPAPMPESVTDRPTKSHEYVFLLTKKPRYFYDHIAIMGPIKGSGVETFARPCRNARAFGKPSGNEKTGATWHASHGANCRSVWRIAANNFRGAHFATMPLRLAARCIKAGTSQKGACPACGAPWVRIIKKGKSSYETAGRRDGKDFGRPDCMPGTAGNNRTESGTVPSYQIPKSKTVGWRPSCRCPGAADKVPVPAVVLDPFGGAGTTPLVATALGRIGIAFDLSRDYLKMTRRRIDRPHAKVAPIKPKDEFLPLFPDEDGP